MRNGKTNYKPSIGVVYAKKLTTKKGKPATAIQVVLEESMLADIAANGGKIRLKGFLNPDQEDSAKFYSYLEVDTFVPKANGAAKGKRAATPETTEDEDDSTPF